MRLPSDAEADDDAPPPSASGELKRGRSIYIYVVLSVVLPALFLSALVGFTEEAMMRSLARRGAEGLLCQSTETVRTRVAAQFNQPAFRPALIDKLLYIQSVAAVEPGQRELKPAAPGAQVALDAPARDAAGGDEGTRWAMRVAPGSWTYGIEGLAGTAVRARLDRPPADMSDDATALDRVTIGGRSYVTCSLVLDLKGSRFAEYGKAVFVVGWPIEVLDQKAASIAKSLMTTGLLRYVLLPVVVLLVLMVVAVQLAIFYPNLRRLDADINAVLRGKADRLTGNYPREVYPITSRFNEVIEDNDAALSYIRSLVTKIAHDLNNKLQSLVLAIDAPEIDRKLVRRQIAGLKNQIDRYQQLAISSRTESHAKWRAERFDLVAFVEDTLWVQRIDLTNAHNVYRLRVEGELLPENPEPGEAALRPVIEVSGHKGDLEIMLANLLSNASKYGKGLIEVGLRTEGGAIVIDVDDNGPGIPEGDRKRVFEEGTMLNPDQQLPGTGFGLDIVMMIANLSRGEVRAGESDLGGARFTLILPILARD